MGAIRLYLTEGYELKQARDLADVLNFHLNIDGPRFVVRKSDGGLQQYIQLLGSWETWTAGLGIVVAAFLAKIGQRAADGFWDIVRDRLKGGQVKPLADASQAIAAAGRATGTSAQIVIGLDLPDAFFGTAHVIRRSEPEEIAYALAQFTAVAQKISSCMQAEIEAGRSPLGRAIITFLDDETGKIAWTTQDFKIREIYIRNGRVT